MEAYAKRVDANRAARASWPRSSFGWSSAAWKPASRTTFNVLSFQRDLSAAEANELRATADYFESLANLESVRGTVLEANQIEM